nr:hypothetical protein BaRGS_000695 [Batillaria attramentaria]
MGSFTHTDGILRVRVYGKAKNKSVRGKRSAVGWKNQLGDINTVDIAKTFNLDLPLVEEMFIVADADKSGALDGQEVLVFIGLIGEYDK